MKVENIFIEVEEDDIDLTSAGLAYGHLTVKVGDNYYPDEKWQDFVQIVLCWWLIAVRELSSCKNSKATLNFMDGPYSIVLHKNETGIFWQLFFVRTTQNNSEILSTTLVDPYEFMVAITQAANSLTRACRRIGISTEDGELLEHELKGMQKHLKREMGKD